MAPSKAIRPIIVIKKKVSGAGHHGGAWKVAYADFMTAMMSLFIVLWLLNTTPQIKKAVAGYFNDPLSGGKETGTKALGVGESVSIDQKNVANLKEQIEKAILRQADLTKLSKQVEITMTGEGLRIELIEDSGGTFYQSGSPKLSDNGVKLLDMLAEQLKVLPNHLMIEGHTDAQPYSGNKGYSNWELSSDRANAARQLLQDAGLRQDQISQVRGYADQSLRIPSNPLDPSNRRVSLIVQWADASSTPQPVTTPGAAKPGIDAPGKSSSTGTVAPAILLPPASTTQSALAKPPSPTKPTWSQRIQALIPVKKK
jgi:chemotaxis protein MotB